MQENLDKKVGQATKWSSITEIAARLAAPITSAVLARLLAPEAFGVVATLIMVVSFAEIFTDAGFQKYLVQHQFADKEDLDKGTNVAFWTNLILSLVIWGLIALFATPIANLVGSPGNELAIIVISAEIPLLAFSSIQMARYRREFDFKNLFVARMATAAVPLVVTVPLAIIFRSYWALVLGTLARDALNAVILTVKSPWKPRLAFSLSKLKEMLSISLWTVVENVTIWLSGHMDIFVVGFVLSDYYLGLYKTTINTGNAYMNLIAAATTPVLFSALSRYQDDDKSFRQVFFQFQRMVAILLFPLGFGLYVFRELATAILLGSQWMETADFLGLWCLTSAFTIVLSHYNSEAFRSKGKPKLSVLTQVLHLVVLVPTLILTVKMGYPVLTASRALVRLEIILVSSVILRVVIGIRFGDVIKNIWPSLLSAMVMAVVGLGLSMLWDNMIWDFVSAIVCVPVYVGSMLLLPAGRRQLGEIPILRKLLQLKETPEPAD